MDFKVGDHICSEMMQVEGVIIEIDKTPDTEMARRSGIIKVRVFVTHDVTWPPAINTRQIMNIDRQHWRVTK